MTDIFFLLDFRKAFDTIEHNFIFYSLEKFDFGSTFIYFIKMLYKDINSSISLSFGTSQRFNTSRGIRQGCPISPLLFILAVEMLAILIDKNSNFDKLNVFGRQIGISQLADDTLFFLRDQYQIDKVIQLICLFSKASGLYLNINKCDLIAIHNSELDSLCNIPIKKSVKYLGITITRHSNQNKSCKQSFRSNKYSQFLDTKRYLNLWKNCIN